MLVEQTPFSALCDGRITVKVVAQGSETQPHSHFRLDRSTTATDQIAVNNRTSTSTPIKRDPFSILFGTGS